MNSAPVLSDAALVVSGLDTERIASIGKSGCQWVDQQILTDNRGPAHFSFDAAATSACFAAPKPLELLAEIEDALAEQIADQQPAPAKGRESAFAGSDIDWLADRFDEALSADAAADQ
jgi:hypothetical protein